MPDIDLKKQAEELGIKIDNRWSDARIQQEIDAKLAESPSTDPLDHDGNGKKGGVAPIKTATVRLKADYWPTSDDALELDPGADRVKAGRVVDLAMAKAKQLISEGKAERADPLPGDE